MMIRAALLMICILAAAYGTLAIVLRSIIVMPLFHPAFAWIVWTAGPPILFATALYAAIKMRQYRLMLLMRAQRGTQDNIDLVRGAASHPMFDNNRAGMELMMEAFVLLSFIAVPFWLHLAYPWLWIGLGFVAVKLPKLIFGK
jgi:hypothetical protein